MNTRLHPLVLGLGLLLPLAASGAQPPNILVILLDDAGYQDFGFMGSRDLATPHLDRLAALGTVFTDAHVTASTCSPSRAGLMTGRYQQRFGHENNTPPDHQGMAVAERTIGDHLRAAGYRTHAIGKWHLGNRAPFHPNARGFDEFLGLLEGSRSYFPDPAVDEPFNPRALLHNRLQIPFTGYLTDVLTDRALDTIAAGSSPPWFIYLAYTAPHTPMEAREDHLAEFDVHPRRKLAAMMRSVDDNVGRLLDALKARGELHDTLIVMLSDNGGATNNQSRNTPLKGWKGNKFEGGHRVPMVIAWPAVLPAGRRFDGLASSLDLLPTLLAAAGASPAAQAAPLDGVDLLPFLRGERSGDPHARLFWRKDRAAAVRAGSWKLLRLEGYGFRLYDLATDASEARDLSATHPAVVEDLAAALTTWERNLVPPAWEEPTEWVRVTFDIHRALMDNTKPPRLSPPATRAPES